jgi:hypothetical protein
MRVRRRSGFRCSGALGFAAGLLLLAGGCGGGGNGSGSAGGVQWAGFRSPVRYELGGAPAASLNAADLNDDPWPDLVALDAVSGNLKVLFGQRGGFAPVSDRPGAAMPVQTAVADFDRDGHSDVAVLQDEASAFTVWRGTGDGTFVAGPTYPLRERGRRLRAADVNGDRYPDLVVASARADGFRVTVFLGSAAGTFTEHWSEHDAMPAFRDLTVGRVDGDGVPDLVLSFYEEGEPVWVLKGRGDGTFEDPVRLPSLVHPPDHHDGTSRVAVADLDGDGRGEIVTSHDIGNYQMVSVRPSRAAGGFGEAVRLATDQPEEIAIVDLNGDERPDLVVANRHSSGISCCLNLGGGRFAAPRFVPLGGTGANPAALAVGDFDRDAEPDVAVVTQGQRAVVIFYNRGNEPERAR